MEMNRKSEEGQVLVIVAVIIIVLLGFVSLTVDGGMAYVDRRGMQNAADAGALAGAWRVAYGLEEKYPQIINSNWSCGMSRITEARNAAEFTAIGQADVNAYDIDLDISDNNGVETYCYELDYGTYIDKFIDVEIQITHSFETGFARLIGMETMTNTVTAVTRIWPRTSLAYGYSIVALNDSLCSGNSNGLVALGTVDTQVTGGGVFSNGCLKSNGAGLVNVTGGTVGYVGEFVGENGGSKNNFTPTPESESTKIPMASVQVPKPDCTEVPVRTQGSSPLLPGRYTDISISSGNWVFEPGLYCITGTGDDALQITGGIVTGQDVTFFFTQGGFTFSGTAEIDFSAPMVGGNEPAIQGILFFGGSGNYSLFTLNGTSTSVLKGTILAPSGSIMVNGTGSVSAFQSQIIGYNVFLGGTANVDVFFSPDQNYQTPSLMNLQK